MIKICFVTTVPMTLKAFVVELSKYLHETGEFDISMVCAPEDNFKESLPPFIHYYPIKMRRGINLDFFLATHKLKKLFKSEKFDIVQYSTPNASFYASTAAKLAKVPTRIYCQWGIAYVAFKGLKRKLFRALEKHICRISTAVEPDSNGNLNFSKEEGLYDDKKGHVIWNGSASGVSLEKFDISKRDEWRKEIRAKHNIGEDDKVYIFVGRITRDKGIIELFTAFKEIIKENKNAKLLMVGTNENFGDVPDSLYKWSLEEPNIIYCGFSNCVEKYLAASDVYVLPSYREGFGSAVIEAEAMGIPVVITDIPGPTNAMLRDETGLVAKKADTQSLLDCMKEIMFNEEKRKTMGEKAYAFATENFEQKTLFKKIMEDRIALSKGDKEG